MSLGAFKFTCFVIHYRDSVSLRGEFFILLILRLSLVACVHSTLPTAKCFLRGHQIIYSNQQCVGGEN